MYEPTMIVLFVAAGWLLLLFVVFGVCMRSTVIELWREPVLRLPVLVIESDDWGPGPKEDAAAISRLASILGRHQDQRGNHAVATLGIVLAIPDTVRIKASKDMCYASASLLEPKFAAILTALRHGIDSGVFGAQLHGMEHYWPEAVVRAARVDANVRAWLTQSEFPRTENLPPQLQSRWVDGAVLPTEPLPSDIKIEAAAMEVRQFTLTFGEAPVVVVPPTFVWDATVEKGWVSGGARFIVTPGVRHVGRDREGRLISGSRRIFNGKQSPSGAIYIVRDDYFEPARGHKAEHAVDALVAKTRLRRPALFETHRFNFTGEANVRDDAFEEVERLLQLAIQRLPTLVFMTTAELGNAMAKTDECLIESRLWPRLSTCLLRTARIGRLRKIAWLTGAVLPAAILYFVACRFGGEPLAQSGLR